MLMSNYKEGVVILLLFMLKVVSVWWVGIFNFIIIFLSRCFGFFFFWIMVAKCSFQDFPEFWKTNNAQWGTTHEYFLIYLSFSLSLFGNVWHLALYRIFFPFQTVVTHLFSDIMLKFGFLRILHSDKGTEHKSILIEHLS